MLGHFRILSRLGAGGMGEVLLAEDTRLGRRVALKVIAPSLVRDPGARDRFLQEARAASSLDHPNICAIFGIETAADGRMAIVMAYYEGRTLEQVMDHGGLPLADALGVIAQAAEGLAAAHDAGIVHRDIKPANIMVTRDGLVKVLDFGVARIEGLGLTRTGTTVGTPAYMAPEQIRGEAVDARADLWSLGVTLYALLAHRHPFPADTAHGLVYAALERAPEPLAAVAPQVPAEVAAVVGQCLAKRREDRFASARDLASALRRCLAELPEAAAGALPPAAEQALAHGSRALRPQPQLPSEAVHSGAQTTPLAPATGHAVPAASAPRRRRFAWAVAGLLVAAAAALTVLWPTVWPGARPLRIAVLPAVVEGVADSTAARLAVAATEAALLRAVAPLRGVTVVDASELRDLRGGPAAAARALAADELIEPRLVAGADEWLVTLRRLSGRDARLLGVRSFQAPAGPAIAFANALGIEVWNTWRERAGSRTPAPLQVSREDYDAFVQLYRLDRERETGGMSQAALQERMTALAASAPRFLDAQLLLADHSHRRFLTTRDTTLLATMAAALARAERAAPDDPRLQGRVFNLALARADLGAAARALEALEVRLPGDPEVQRRAATLAEREGDGARALGLLRDAARRRPSRLMLQALADLELRQGEGERARVLLDTLVARFPEDRFPRSKLAQLELMTGDPARADTLYSWLLAGQPGQVASLTNRGLARMLRGDYAGAERDFAASLELAPDNLDVALNRADCLALAGRSDEARALDTRIERDSRLAPDAGEVFNRLRRAQSLARLGQAVAARDLARAALAEARDDAEAHYAAAVVAARAAMPDSALAWARRARELGIGASWFALPWFAEVRSRPEFARAAPAR
jgi:Flp pilus assembly protein TadD